MPGRRSEAPLYPVEALVLAAIDKTGGTDAGLARELGKLGLDTVNLAKSVGRWRKGEHAPEYAPTLALMTVAGWLDERAIRRDLAAAAERASKEALTSAEAVAQAEAQRDRPARPPRKRKSA